MIRLQNAPPQFDRVGVYLRSIAAISQVMRVCISESRLPVTLANFFADELETGSIESGDGSGCGHANKALGIGQHSPKGCSQRCNWNDCRVCGGCFENGAADKRISVLKIGLPNVRRK